MVLDGPGVVGLEEVADADRPGRLEALAAAGEDDRADGGDEQQEGRDLEGEQVVRQQQARPSRRATRSLT